jgi:hypothetical protein
MMLAPTEDISLSTCITGTYGLDMSPAMFTVAMAMGL